MKYDFTSIMDRHGKDAIAVDGLGTGFAPAAPKEGFDAIPMWVADMNFPTVPTIQEAIIERTNHPAFGYFNPTDEYFDSIIRWQAKRNGVQGLTKECIGYENGVLGGVISALNCVCSRGDKILIHSPTYMGFTLSLKNNGYEAVHSPLVKDENGVWRMDFEDMEKHLKEEKIHARPDRCLQARGLRVDRRALRGADRQHRLCLRLHREALRGRDRLQAAGYLYAVRGLHRLVQGPRQDH